MYSTFIFIPVHFFSCTSSGQNILCKDCQGLYEYPRANQLIATDTLPVYHEGCADKMIITGVVFRADGKTPASNVIVYIYHTNAAGRYPTKGSETGLAKEHGYNRGWIKTSEDGKYKFVTCKPGHYPGGRDAAHIHAILKEPDKTAYWIDDFLFEGDPKLTAKRIASMKERGGSGVMALTKNEKGELFCHRNIYLGRNIPGHK